MYIFYAKWIRENTRESDFVKCERGSDIKRLSGVILKSGNSEVQYLVSRNENMVKNLEKSSLLPEYLVSRSEYRICHMFLQLFVTNCFIFFGLVVLT